MMLSALGDKKWIFYTLPGFISLFVASFVSDFPIIRDTKLPFVYLILTLLSVIIPLLAAHLYGYLYRISISVDKLLKNPLFVAVVFIFSIFLGFSAGVMHNNDTVSRVLRSWFGERNILVSSHSELIKVLFRDSYNEHMLDGQPHITDDEKDNLTNVYARINIYKDGSRSIEGVVASYFGGEDAPQVYLSPACQIDEGVAIPVKGPGVWVSLTYVGDIHFIYAQCSPCALKYEELAGNSGPFNCPLDSGGSNNETALPQQPTP